MLYKAKIIIPTYDLFKRWTSSHYITSHYTITSRTYITGIQITEFIINKSLVQSLSLIVVNIILRVTHSRSLTFPVEEVSSVSLCNGCTLCNNSPCDTPQCGDCQRHASGYLRWERTQTMTSPRYTYSQQIEYSP